MDGSHERLAVVMRPPNRWLRVENLRIALLYPRCRIGVWRLPLLRR